MKGVIIMSLVKWSGPRSVFRFDDMYNSFFENEFGNLNGWLPVVDSVETDNEYILTAELPGLSKKDLKVTFQDDSLTLEGEKNQIDEDKEKTFHRYERHYGKFRRSFKIPKLVNHEKIKASFKDGLLTINLPKTEEVKPKDIEISVN